ncbi:MAG: FadR family transcriptional regulator [Methylobacteriaceae bacterium]|nr:FadR family transcriptional regulator [Methylobacteriaceae bacterium]
MSLLDNIDPFSRKPIAEQVANRLLDLIRSGNLKAGDKLPTEHELAAALQVSRTVVREALRGLSILGVVGSRQGGRCYVTDLTPARLLAPLRFVISLDESNVEALHGARLVIDTGIAREACLRGTDAALDRLDNMVRAGRALVEDPVGFRVMDQAFHQTIAELAGNPFLERVAQSLYELGMEYRRIASEMPGVLATSAAEHAVIVAALRAGDPERAAAAMAAHLSSIHRTTLAAMHRAGAPASADPLRVVGEASEIRRAPRPS